MVYGTAHAATQISDARLVEMTLSGDPGAFDALVKRFQRAVHAVVFAVLSDRDAALDALQETFIAAYSQLSTLDDASRFGPWVCGIARNQAKRTRRVRYRHASRELPMSDGDLVPQTPQADTLALSIRDALSCLTEAQADVVALFYMEGYSIAECADLLGTPTGTIKRRLYDARQKLKKEMIDMVRENLPEFALPEDYRVVIDRPSRLPDNRTTLSWFKDRWVMVWQDGIWWGPERWRCDTFEYWLSESTDAKTWSEPRRLEFAGERFPDADAFHLTHSCVHAGRLYLSSYMHNYGTDIYSSEDLVHWSVHPRLRTWASGRGDILSAGESLIVTYPAWVAARPYCGDRVDVMESPDGGSNWHWVTPAAWPMAIITDTAGLAVGDRIYVAWRQRQETDFRGWSEPGAHSPAEVCISWSENGGTSWSEPVNVEQLALDRETSWTLQLASDGKRLAMCQEVWDEVEGGRSEIWLTFSNDGGQTWSERAVYCTGSLLDPAIAFTPDGSLILAGSSRSEDGSRPWVIHSHITV